MILPDFVRTYLAYFGPIFRFSVAFVHPLPENGPKYEECCNTAAKKKIHPIL